MFSPETLFIISWVLFVIAIAGTILNIKKSVYCFYLWGVSNLLWTGYNWYIGEIALAAQFAINLITCAWGVYEWKRSK